jgi:RNA polymerase sigma-70 factor (ECF subfamily)
VEKRQRLIIDQIPALRRYARALTGERHAADELVQDSLERAWSRFHLWRPGTDVRAWLFTIMHNLYANAVRKAKRAPAYAPLAEVDRMSPIQSNAEAGLEVSSLIQALASLPDNQREVLLLVSLEGLTYVQISQVLGIPIGTVMSRLSRAREHLRQIISGTSRKDTKRAR